MTRGVRILLIDDSDITLHFIQKVLEKHGYDVRATRSLDEFDAVLRDWLPSLILTDVNMPGMTGVELCSWLKNRYETASIPIVLFSSLPEAELAELVRECAADGYLSKVNGLDRLPDELARVCREILW